MLRASRPRSIVAGVSSPGRSPVRAENSIIYLRHLLPADFPDYSVPASSPLLCIAAADPVAAPTLLTLTPERYSTSRGFAVVDVTAGGSTYFASVCARGSTTGVWWKSGRLSRTPAFYLVAGEVDGERLAIRSGGASVSSRAPDFPRCFQGWRQLLRIGDL